jgi:hypothetical protein
VPESLPASTTLLGDWYANILFSRPQLVLFLNERTFLPVVVPASSHSSLGARFIEGLGELLQAIGVSSNAIETELRQMDALAYAPTKSRSMLGSMQEFMFHFGELAYRYPGPNIMKIELHLAEMPCARIDYQFPREAALEVFRGDGASHAQLQ